MTKVARFFEVHPQNPQQRTINQVVQMIQQDALIAYPTDSGYALGCRLGNVEGVERIRDLRRLDDKHHYTIVCHDFAQLSQFVFVSNKVFRLIKAATPGSYTFILPATREVPRRFMNPKKRTVGVRIPPTPVVQALVTTLGEPLLSSTLLMPGDDQPMSDGWEVKERLDHAVDAVIDAGECGTEPTTVVDMSEAEPVVVRVGAGDPTPVRVASAGRGTTPAGDRVPAGDRATCDDAPATRYAHAQNAPSDRRTGFRSRAACSRWTYVQALDLGTGVGHPRPADLSPLYPTPTDVHNSNACTPEGDARDRGPVVCGL